MDVETRHRILTDVWVPDNSFKFPGSGKRNLKFQLHWLNRWKWLTYSQVEDGAYCRYCVLFSSHGAGVGHQPLGKLVKSKFSVWKDAVEEFNKHEKAEYHKTCVLRASQFSLIATKKKDAIDVQIDTSKKKDVEANRKRIIPIIETIILCGRQGLPLRGHRDFGPIVLNDEEPVENDGNFRALLRFRARGGDQDLRAHLESSGRNSMYISPQTQNEIIDVCGTFIVEHIVNRVNKSRCFTVLADETTDISGVEQMSLCIRYIDSDCQKIREDFLQFVPITDATGRGLASKILSTLQKIGVNLKYLRGQGYDGARAMSGQFNGVQAIIRETYPLALYMHCSSHVLNLAITHACSVQGIRNCLGSVGNICSFFRHPKKLNALKESIEVTVPETDKTRLKQLCPTRWVERHDSVSVFLELFDAVVDAFENIAQWNDQEAATSAQQLLCAMQTSEFLVSIHVLNKVFAISAPLSRFFQSEELDIAKAIAYADVVEDRIARMRENAPPEFTKIFAQASKKASQLSTQITIPRLGRHQRHRWNVDTTSPEEYFRISIYIPFLDSFLVELKERFTSHRETLQSFMCLLPTSGKKTPNSEDEEAMQFLVQKYAKDLQCSVESVIGEMSIWYGLLTSLKEAPKSALESLLLCDENNLPAIYTLLRVFATLPVSIASSERSFSTLRRLKNYLRNATSEHRLNGLTLLNVHRDIIVKPIDVLDLFSSQSRKLKLRM